ncbi:unnamed protein product, partial [Brassica oleracea]
CRTPQIPAPPLFQVIEPQASIYEKGRGAYRNSVDAVRKLRSRRREQLRTRGVFFTVVHFARRGQLSPVHLDRRTCGRRGRGRKVYG